jgi:DtxR family Mn-dependent transcriptional regulator
MLSHEFFTAPEMYLKTIYNLERKEGAARTGDIAKILKITPGSVTNTLEVLEGKGLVTREPYKGVVLTDQGRKLALSVFRRHRLAERLLVDVLQMDWAESHDEACKLEHSISDAVASSIEKKLEDPKTCPHGNPIPDEKGSIPPVKSDALSNLENGERAIVCMIPDESTELLRYLSTLGMFPGAKISVEEKAPFKGPMLVKVGENAYPISLDVASGIFVTKEK